MGYCPSKKPGAGEETCLKRNYREPEELVHVIMFSSRGAMGFLKNNGVEKLFWDA